MYRLLEDEVKTWLSTHGLPVPAGYKAGNPSEAAAAVAKLPHEAVIKALVPTGRRGKAGAVRFAGSPEEGSRAAPSTADA